MSCAYFQFLIQILYSPYFWSQLCHFKFFFVLWRHMYSIIVLSTPFTIEYFQFPARNRTLYFYCYMLQIFPLFPFLCPHTIYLPVSAIILMSISFNPSLRSSWKQYLIRCFILRTVLSRVMLLFQQVITLPQRAQYTSIQKQVCQFFEFSIPTCSHIFQIIISHQIIPNFLY